MDRGTGSAIKRFYRVSYRFTTGKAIESPCPVINKQDCLHGDEVFGHSPLQGHFEQLHALNRKGANRSSDHSIYSPLSSIGPPTASAAITVPGLPRSGITIKRRTATYCYGGRSLPSSNALTNLAMSEGAIVA